MNVKMRDELQGIIDESIFSTEFIETPLDEIRDLLIDRGLTLAESNVLAASVKYIIALRNYEKPELTEVQKNLIRSYWSHVKDIDVLVGAWGDMTLSTTLRKFSRIGIYTKAYIEYVVHVHPEIVYYKEPYDGSKMICMSKLVKLLYEDYRKENL